MLEVLEHSDRSLAESAYCPPAPKPQPCPLKPIALIRTLKRNPLDAGPRSTSSNRVAGGLPVGHVLLVHEPNAIGRVLARQRRKLPEGSSAAPGAVGRVDEGLPSAEGEQWRLRRRVVAPKFSRKTVMDFTPAMMGAADVLIKRRSCLGDRATIDVAAEMAELARRGAGYLRA